MVFSLYLSFYSCPPTLFSNLRVFLKLKLSRRFSPPITSFGPTSPRLRRKFVNVKLVSFFSKKNFLCKRPPRNLAPVFGNAGFYPESPLILTNSFLSKFILYLKRVIRKRGKSLRFFFFKPLNLIKVSKQSKGARMGKGKGKTLTLVQRFSPLSFLVEFDGVRVGRLVHYFRLFRTRFPATLTLSLGVSNYPALFLRFTKNDRQDFRTLLLAHPLTV